MSTINGSEEKSLYVRLSVTDSRCGFIDFVEYVDREDPDISGDTESVPEVLYSVKLTFAQIVAVGKNLGILVTDYRLTD